MFERYDHEGGSDHQEVPDNEAAIRQGAEANRQGVIVDRQGAEEDRQGAEAVRQSAEADNEKKLKTLTSDILSLADTDCDKSLYKEEIDLIW